MNLHLSVILCYSMYFIYTCVCVCVFICCALHKGIPSHVTLSVLCTWYVEFNLNPRLHGTPVIHWCQTFSRNCLISISNYPSLLCTFLLSVFPFRCFRCFCCHLSLPLSITSTRNPTIKVVPLK